MKRHTPGSIVFCIWLGFFAWEVCAGRAAYSQENPGARAEVVGLSRPITLQDAGFDLSVGDRGSLRLVKDSEEYVIESVFSYPDEHIGYNALSEQPNQGSHPLWKPTIRKEGPDKVVVLAACPHYSFHRVLHVHSGKVTIQDTFKNTGRSPVGIQIEYRVSGSKAFRQCLLAGALERMVTETSANPSIFIESGNGRLGIVAEDDVLRRQFCGMVAGPDKAVFKTDHFGLDTGESRTLEWSAYPLSRESDYFDFVNRVRKDWNTNFTIEGPWDFFHVQENASHINNPDALRAFLKRKHLRIVALTPWFGWDNIDLDTGLLLDRDSYKRIIQHGATAFRELDPNIRLIGCIESFTMSLPVKDSRTLLEQLPPKQYWYRIPEKTLEGIEGFKTLDVQQRECLFQSPEGEYLALVVPNRLVPLSALCAYPAPGNAQQASLMEQARFLIEDVGLDGIYIDSFNLAYGDPRMTYSYDHWDGATVDLDPATGRIARKYTDAGLVGARARAELIRYVLGKGKVMVANTYAISQETQALPVFRFCEAEGDWNPLKIAKGEEPPLVRSLCGGQLASPICLAFRPASLSWSDPSLATVYRDNYSQIIMKTVITYLRHGLLYYEYTTEIPGGSGPGSGEYGPVNHMFPITPVELHEGWILGKERILTARSGTYRWDRAEKPQVMVFDITGRPVEARSEINRSGEGWSVTLNLEDWENVAVVE